MFTQWWTLSVVSMTFVWPVLAGVLLGAGTVLYLFALEGADVSKVVSLENTYPLLVTFLSCVVLNDKITPVGYLGIGITVAGAMLLSVDFKCCSKRAYATSSHAASYLCACAGLACFNHPERRALLPTSGSGPVPIASPTMERPSVQTPDLESDDKGDPKTDDAAKNPRGALWLVLLMAPVITCFGVSEFFTKLSTSYMPPLAITAVSYTLYGVVLTSPALALADARHFLPDEAYRNWYWPLLSETLMLCSNATLTVAMSSLAAPVVSAVAASSPVFVLLLEHCFGMAEPMSLRRCLAFRLVPVITTVTGVVLLTLESFLGPDSQPLFTHT
eukprot:TRINITY_DN8236_c0_g1_i1.p1 TRINITY_DN8236_c0_g1~~TRINITY_DN8236_c0_g1_i1.p1  ORF type:complete len:331 (+),score=97.78 TRINITY_DN8236_c0_g1_i1:81-1073(+)